MSDDLPHSLNYADSDARRFVPIAEFRDEANAHMAASVLENEDIASVISDVVRIAGANRPSVLKVSLEDFNAAVAILEKTPARDFLIRKRNR